MHRINKKVFETGCKRLVRCFRSIYKSCVDFARKKKLLNNVGWKNDHVIYISGGYNREMIDNKSSKNKHIEHGNAEYEFQLIRLDEVKYNCGHKMGKT